MPTPSRWGWTTHATLAAVVRGRARWHAHALGDQRGAIAVVAACGRLAPDGHLDTYATKCLGVACASCARAVARGRSG